jgi:hypothetical protein
VWAWVLAVTVGRLLAAEPDGVFVLRSAADGPDHVRVTVQALVPLEEVVVTWTGPPGVAVKAAQPGGEKADRLALGQVPGNSLHSLRLQIEGERGAGPARVLVVRVEGIFRGRAVREAIGIPLGEPEPGRLLGDVVEFDAALEPHP